LPGAAGRVRYIRQPGSIRWQRLMTSVMCVRRSLRPCRPEDELHRSDRPPESLPCVLPRCRNPILCLPLRLLYRIPAVRQNSWCAGPILRPAHTSACDGQTATVCDLPTVETDWLAPPLGPAGAHAVMDACFS